MDWQTIQKRIKNLERTQLTEWRLAQHDLTRIESLIRDVLQMLIHRDDLNLEEVIKKISQQHDREEGAVREIAIKTQDLLMIAINLFSSFIPKDPDLDNSITPGKRGE